MMNSDTPNYEEDIDVPGRDRMNEVDDPSNTRMYRDIDFLPINETTDQKSRDILYDEE